MSIPWSHLLGATLGEAGGWRIGDPASRHTCSVDQQPPEMAHWSFVVSNFSVLELKLVFPTDLVSVCIEINSEAFSS